MKTQHTPGPWSRARYSDSDSESLAIVAANPFGDGEWGIAQAYGWGGDKHQESEANADLIAAAPDLLEACRDFVSKLDDFFAGKINIRPDYAHRARLAIAKAMGESQQETQEQIADG